MYFFFGFVYASIFSTHYAYPKHFIKFIKNNLLHTQKYKYNVSAAKVCEKSQKMLKNVEKKNVVGRINSFAFDQHFLNVNLGE